MKYHHSHHFTYKLLLPQHWPAWLFVGLLFILAHLPRKLQLALGRLFGKFTYYLLKKRRLIAARNIDLCFPNKNSEEKNQMVRMHFESLGIALFETAMAWWLPTSRFEKLITVKNKEYIKAAGLGEGPVIVIGPHHTTMDLMGRFMETLFPIALVYREQNNPVINYLLHRFRHGQNRELINRSNVRAMVQALKNNIPLWFPPDQDFGRRHSVFAPFMGVNAATITTPMRLANLTGARILPVGFHRKKDGGGYEITIYPPLENFPSEDITQDASALNLAIAQSITDYPAQYYWLHRRFKTRPEGEMSVY